MGEIYVDMENIIDDNICCIDVIWVLYENVFIYGYVKYKNKLDWVWWVNFVVFVWF